MVTIQTHKQVAAVDALVSAFESRHLESLLGCAGNVFRSCDATVLTSKDVDRFNVKMKAKDPRFASVFTRTVDALRTSSSIHNVDALVELLIKCRMMHVFYTSSGRERAEARECVQKSPYFSRRSASRGKLKATDTAKTVSNNYHVHSSVNSQQATPLHNSTTSFTPISAKNLLFGSSQSEFSAYGSSSYPSNESLRVLRIERSKSNRTSLDMRMGMTSSVSARSLCLELCGALVGLEGSYFRIDANGYMRIIESCSLSQSQKSVVESVLNLAHLYVDIVRFHAQCSDDPFLQAFLLSSQDIIEEYIHGIREIPTSCRPLHLVRVASTVELWRDRLIELHRLHSLRHEFGSILLELMSTLYSSVSENFVVDRMMDSCCGVLCRLISRLMSGAETGQDEKETFAQRSIKGCHFSLIPSFLPAWIANYIIKIEKSWNTMDFRKNIENLDKARNIVATQLDSRAFYVIHDRYKLERVVKEVCRLVCGSVVRCFIVEHHIIDHFDAARSFLLLHDPIFSIVLYQKFCECTYGMRSKLSQRDANNALIAAAALSPAIRRFPFRVKLDTLSSATDSPNTSSRLQFVQPLRPFYHPDEPVLQIFKETDRRYESLFQFLWPVEMCLLMISENACSIGQLSARKQKGLNNGTSFLRLISSLLACIERTLLRLRMYTVEMTNHWFKRLRCDVDEAIDLDAIVDAHSRYLDGLSASLFLTNDTEEIYGLITSILQISHDLSLKCSEFLTKVESKEPTVWNDLTDLAVIRAKLQAIIPGLIIRVQDLRKCQNNSAFAILLGIVD
ncbi:hypothetical protein RB195_010009 [Necator americanus]|uniref:Gamma-tubulin complex component n=1 Tax=Necator americanus TaxID=51031 RepID=A0ABR1CX38_NECAM